MERSNRRRLLHTCWLLPGLIGVACAHKREVAYPGGDDGLVSVRTDRGVRVRAPFVDATSRAATRR